MAKSPPSQLMTPNEVAALFGVHAKTLNRWNAAGKLRATRTLGGHRRYFRDDVERILAERETAAEGDAA